MAYSIFIPSALTLYQHGLNRMFDSHWVTFDLRHYMDEFFLNSTDSKKLCHDTLPNGLLYYLGRWLFEDCFVSEENIIGEPVHQWRHLSQLLYLINQSGCPKRKAFLDALLFLDHIDQIWDGDSIIIFNRRYRRRKYYEEILSIYFRLLDSYTQEISDLTHIYAINFAERVFHDRQYCEFVSYIVASLYDFSGFPVIDERNRLSVVKVTRKAWPTWVRDVLRARERGKCAECGASFDELEGEIHIDHIIPLAKGGFNDLANLQLLCEMCNKKKGVQEIRVNSSIPNYLSNSKTIKAWKRFL